MDREQLSSLVDLDKVDAIMMTIEDVSDYFEFKSIIDLGCTVSHSDLSFEKLMLYSWIKRELANG